MKDFNIFQFLILVTVLNIFVTISNLITLSRALLIRHPCYSSCSIWFGINTNFLSNSRIFLSTACYIVLCIMQRASRVMNEKALFIMHNEDDIYTEHNMNTVCCAAVAQWTKRLTHWGQTRVQISKPASFLILQSLCRMSGIISGSVEVDSEE